MVFIKDDSFLKLYVNGDLSESIVDNHGTFSITDGFLEVGAPNYWNGGWSQNGRAEAKWHGKIDDVSFYNIAITESEIEELYCEDECGVCGGDSSSCNEPTADNFSVQVDEDESVSFEPAGEDPCDTMNCPDSECDGDTWKYNGYCSNGNCYFSSSTDCNNSDGCNGQTAVNGYCSNNQCQTRNQ